VHADFLHENGHALVLDYRPFRGVLALFLLQSPRCTRYEKKQRVNNFYHRLLSAFLVQLCAVLGTFFGGGLFCVVPSAFPLSVLGHFFPFFLVLAVLSSTCAGELIFENFSLRPTFFLGGVKMV
jgi:hypothetical protein